MGIIESTKDLTSLAVAAHDLGRYAKYSSNGRV